jgi:predicted outer membrane repeat protein
MFRTLLDRLCMGFRRRHAGRVRARKPARWRPSFIPRLYACEDRILPSTVTNLNDSGPGSLRDAIQSAASGDTITFDPSLNGGTIYLTSGALQIAKNLTIIGPGAPELTVDGSSSSTVFVSGGIVSISGVTIADGYQSSEFFSGGGIVNTGTLTLDAVVLANNYSAGNGGGISNRFDGTVTIIDSLFTGNYAAGTGGAIYSDSGVVTVTSSTLDSNGVDPTNQNSGGGAIWNQTGMLVVDQSTISNNYAGFTGGGIEGNWLGGVLRVSDSTFAGNGSFASNGRGGGLDTTAFAGDTAVVSNSTFAGNSATATGGGINAADLTLSNSTLTGNSANFGGALATGDNVVIDASTIAGNTDNFANGAGGIYNPTSTFRIRDTIVAANTGPSGESDVAGPVQSNGYNLIGFGFSGQGWLPSDLVGTFQSPIDPMLGGLNDNGSPTQTMAPLPGSPALDAGAPSLAGTPDQRGVMRAATPNIGAYEAAAVALVVSGPTDVTAGQPFDVTVTAVDPYGQLAVGYTGTVDLSSTDPADPFLGEYTFTLADGGQYTFSGVTLDTSGPQTVSAVDAANGLSGSYDLVVESAGPTRPSRGVGAQTEPAPSRPAEVDALEATLAGLTTRRYEPVVSPAMAAALLPQAVPYSDDLFLAAEVLALPS